MANGETAKSKAAGGTAAGKTRLVIVESPAKARKIGGYLGSNYDVRASVGHIRDLAQPSQIPAKDKEKYGKFGVDVDDDFKPYYIVGSDKKQTVSDLKKALKKADELYLATDEDREGEAIAWHLVQTLKPEIPVKRMVSGRWLTRRRPGEFLTGCTGLSSARFCGEKSVRSCRPAACSQLPQGLLLSAKRNVSRL